MNSKLQSDQDQRLNALLAEWRVEGDLPPRFSESVWRRIENGEEAPGAWQIARSWFERTFARPTVALAYCAILIGGGIALGSWRGQEQSSHAQAQLEARYVQAISPYHKAH
jgi:hypothetical protein